MRRMISFITVAVFIVNFSNLAAISAFACSAAPDKGSPRVIKITGAVTSPLTLCIKELGRFQATQVQLNEITADKKFHGVFTYKGVSLKTLLRMAHIEKQDTDFKKQTDLVVNIKSTDGKNAVLSWGEIFYKDAGEIIIAVSAHPIFPHKGSDHFKDKEAYRKMIKVLKREIGFPKLAVGGDFYTDRCLENVHEIEVVDLRPKLAGKKGAPLLSRQFTIEKENRVVKTVSKLSKKEREKIDVHIVGEGRGYHGTHLFEGVPFVDLIEESEIKIDSGTVFIISAPDAYRVSISYGELFLSPYGRRTLIADKVDGASIDKGGKFILVFPDDLMADREVKSINRIIVQSLK